jgi:type II secretory pathway pseudopilin PulG
MNVVAPRRAAVKAPLARADRSPVFSQRLLSPYRLPLRRLRKRARSGGGAEAGFTLPELLMVIMLSVFAFGALMLPMISTPKIASRDINRAHAIQDVQTGLYRMTRELRQAWAIYSTSGTSIDVATTLGGVTNRVLYKCDSQPAGSTYRQCIRTTATCNESTSPPTCNTAPSTTGGDVVVGRVLNGTSAAPTTPVFSFTPTCTTSYTGTLTYICVKLLVPSSRGGGGGYRTGYQYQEALSDGVYLRNFGLQ